MTFGEWLAANTSSDSGQEIHVELCGGPGDGAIEPMDVRARGLIVRLRLDQRPDAPIICYRYQYVGQGVDGRCRVQLVDSWIDEGQPPPPVPRRQPPTESQS